MKLYLRNLEFGSKLILLSAVLAMLSLFFNWVHFFTIIENGFKQGAYILLLVYLYPILKILLHKEMKKKYGYINAIIGILLGLSYISMRIIDNDGMNYKAYGYGPFIFLIACGLLAYGVSKYTYKEA